MALLKQVCFGTLNTEEINQKEENLQNKNTIVNEHKAEHILKEYMQQSLGLEDFNFFNFTEAELDYYLRLFWFNIRTKKGEHYSSSSLETIRYGLNCSFKRFSHNFDITKRESISFMKSITAYENAQWKLKQLLKGVVESIKRITQECKFQILCHISLNKHSIYI